MNSRSRFAAVISMVAIIMSGCASAQYIKNEDATKVYPVTYDEMFVLAPQAVGVAGMKVKEVRKEEGVVKAVAPPSFWTSSLGNMIAGGDDVTITISKISEKATQVFIKAVATADVMDLGRSARVVETLYKHLDDIVNQKVKSQAAVR